MNEKPGDDELVFDQDDAMVRRAAQRYGTVGAMLAGGMLVFDKLLGRKPKEEAAVVIEAASEPGNIDDSRSYFLSSVFLNDFRRSPLRMKIDD